MTHELSDRRKRPCGTDDKPARRGIEIDRAGALAAGIFALDEYTLTPQAGLNGEAAGLGHTRGRIVSRGGSATDDIGEPAVAGAGERA